MESNSLFFDLRSDSCNIWHFLHIWECLPPVVINLTKSIAAHASSHAKARATLDRSEHLLLVIELEQKSFSYQIELMYM